MASPPGAEVAQSVRGASGRRPSVGHLTLGMQPRGAQRPARGAMTGQWQSREECREEGDPLWQRASVATGEGRLWGAKPRLPGPPGSLPGILLVGPVLSENDFKAVLGFAGSKARAMGSSEGASSLFHAEPGSRSAPSVSPPSISSFSRCGSVRLRQAEFCGLGTQA